MITKSEWLNKQWMIHNIKWTKKCKQNKIDYIASVKKKTDFYYRCLNN